MNGFPACLSQSKSRFTAAVLLLLALLLQPASSANADYDRHFKKAFSRWMPGHDWRLLKAQCRAESALNPMAISPVGAQGICQFMPPTWHEAEDHGVFPKGADPYSAKWNIEAAAWYIRRMHRIWKSPRPEWDRYQLSWASYNAGAGHIIKAQARCNMALLYEDIIFCLPQITGHHAKETKQYSERIERFYKRAIYAF